MMHHLNLYFTFYQFLSVNHEFNGNFNLFFELKSQNIFYLDHLCLNSFALELHIEISTGELLINFLWNFLCGGYFPYLL
jgi:hypothetical protein